VKALFFSVSVLTLASTAALAQQLPQPAPPTPAIAAAQDIPYPGTMKLSIDATDLDRKHLFDHPQTVPVVKPGPMTLLLSRMGPRRSLAAQLHRPGRRHWSPPTARPCPGRATRWRCSPSTSPRRLGRKAWKYRSSFCRP
jgi:hypothetical protein